MGLITTKNLERFANGFAAKAATIFVKMTDIPKSLPANGGNAATVNGHSVDENVPRGAKFTDTVYTHPATEGHRHVPAGGSPGQILRWGAAGTAVWGSDGSSEMAEATDAEIDAIIAGTFK